MIDIVSLGELLVDFAPAGERTYQANAGGAPANVLAAAARLGKKAACITMVGQDDFGDMLVKDLAAAGVDTSAIRRTKDACTTLAFVSLPVIPKLRINTYGVIDVEQQEVVEASF